MKKINIRVELSLNGAEVAGNAQTCGTCRFLHSVLDNKGSLERSCCLFGADLQPGQLPPLRCDECMRAEAWTDKRAGEAEQQLTFRQEVLALQQGVLALLREVANPELKPDPIVEYTLVEMGSAVDLESSVRRAFAKGWILWGDPRYSGEGYYQAMVRRASAVKESKHVAAGGDGDGPKNIE